MRSRGAPRHHTGIRTGSRRTGPLDRTLPRVGAASLLVTVLLLVGTQWASTPRLPSVHTAADFPVRGLHCMIWCPVRVDAAVGRLSGVYGVSVDLEQDIVSVRYDADRIDAETLSRRLAEHAYTPREPWTVRTVGP